MTSSIQTHCVGLDGRCENYLLDTNLFCIPSPQRFPSASFSLYTFTKITIDKSEELKGNRVPTELLTKAEICSIHSGRRIWRESALYIANGHAGGERGSEWRKAAVNWEWLDSIAPLKKKTMVRQRRFAPWFDPQTHKLKQTSRRRVRVCVYKRSQTQL